MPSPEHPEPPAAVTQALSFLRESVGQQALVELSYGGWVLARFRMRLEEAEAEDGLLTLIGDVHELGDALLYSEVNLPLSQRGIYEISLVARELRLSTDEGMQLAVTHLG